MQDLSIARAAALRRWVLALAGVAALVVAAAGTILLVSHSMAQQPAPKAEPKAKNETKADPKQKGSPPPQAQQGEQPQLTYAPWTKVCQSPPDGSGKRVCFTGRDGRIESGMALVAAVLIEPEGDTRKILRVTLPLGMAIGPGTRVIVDQGQPMNAPYVVCIPSGCMADYEASGELVGKLKAAQNLHVQGFNGNGQPVSLMLPLQDFAKAHDGPPTALATLGQPAPKPQ
jgi:invasion protein IalB